MGIAFQMLPGICLIPNSRIEITAWLLKYHLQCSVQALNARRFREAPNACVKRRAPQGAGIQPADPGHVRLNAGLGDSYAEARRPANVFLGSARIDLGKARQTSTPGPNN